MNIATLVENTTVAPEYKPAHGLCLYIATKRHKLLFDLGPGALFLENAAKLGVDVAAVDTVILSHVHIDHGGALGALLKHNHTAKVYIQKTAFEKHYTKVLGIPVNIGIDDAFMEHPQVVLTDEKLVIDDELTLFADVTGKECGSASNDALFAKHAGKMEPDDFSHEHSLIITEDGKHTLIAGCAHKGIINIQKRAEERVGAELDCVISGFHLYNPVTKRCEEDALVREVAARLKTHRTRYYTCHCTGPRAFALLREELGDQMNDLATGSRIEI